MMNDWQNILAGAGVGGGVLIVLGRWVVPLLKKMLDNMVTSVSATGGILKDVQGERDQWRKSYQELAQRMDTFLDEFVKMKSSHEVLTFKLELAERRGKECDEKHAALQENMDRALARIQQLERGS